MHNPVRFLFWQAGFALSEQRTARFIETFVQAFPPVNIDVFDAAFTMVVVLVVCLGVLACCLCRSVTVIVTT